jgi:prophage regulatory protein
VHRAERRNQIPKVSTMNPSTDEPRLVSMNGVVSMTSLSRTMVNRLRAEGRFPQCVPLGDRRVAFVKSEISEWIASRIAARGANDNAQLREIA